MASFRPNLHIWFNCYKGSHSVGWVFETVPSIQDLVNPLKYNFNAVFTTGNVQDMFIFLWF